MHSEKSPERERKDETACFDGYGEIAQRNRSAKWLGEIARRNATSDEPLYRLVPPLPVQKQNTDTAQR